MSETGPLGEGYDADVLREACGVVGVIAFDDRHPVGQIACAVVRELQHRGEDAAGVFVGDSSSEFDFVGVKGLGLVADVFEDGAASLDKWRPTARTAVAHVRYGTSDSKVDPFKLAQPLIKAENGGAGLVLAHNGHIEGMPVIADHYDVDLSDCGSDSEALMRTLSHLAKPSELGNVLAAMHRVLPQLNGGFSLVVAEQGRVHGVRDPWGTRPLALGYLASGAYVFASETAALSAAGPVVNEWEVRPGQIVSIDGHGNLEESSINRQVESGGMCALEGVYFSRVDTILNGRSVSNGRFEMGRRLAEEHPVDADVVIGVPDSGLAAAMGYAEASGIPYRLGITRDSYSGRSFIQANQILREQVVRRKLRPDRSVLDGKRVVVVDDSIVRGTSTETLYSMLRSAGAEEVHFRISSPPNRNPCYAGIATGDPETLLARRIPDVEGMRKKLGVDSLGFLSPEGLAESLGGSVGSLCMACMTGEYPYPVPKDEGRIVLDLAPTREISGS